MCALRHGPHRQGARGLSPRWAKSRGGLIVVIAGSTECNGSRVKATTGHSQTGDYFLRFAPYFMEVSRIRRWFPLRALATHASISLFPPDVPGAGQSE